MIDTGAHGLRKRLAGSIPWITSGHLRWVFSGRAFPSQERDREMRDKGERAFGGNTVHVTTYFRVFGRFSVLSAERERQTRGRRGKLWANRGKWLQTRVADLKKGGDRWEWKITYNYTITLII